MKDREGPRHAANLSSDKYRKSDKPFYLEVKSLIYIVNKQCRFSKNNRQIWFKNERQEDPLHAANLAKIVKKVKGRI